MTPQAPSDRTRRLHVLEQAIAKHEVLLELARTLETRDHRRSNRGWMASMFTLEAGTLMAVLAGSQARRWSSMIHSLELNLLRLKLERHQLQATDVD